MKIVQLMPTISFGDAVGNDARAIKAILEERGYETQIYAENIDGRLPEGTASPVTEMPELCEDDVILYHGSTGTELNYRLPEYAGRKVMIYHNITPPAFFEPYSPGAAQLTSDGLNGIRYLADKLDYCIADSDFNKRDLLQMGYTCPIDVCPVLIPFSDYERTPNKDVISRYHGDSMTNLLFVGRVAPNKKQEDVIAAFYYYRKYYNANSRLFLVGSWGGMEKYYQRLCAYIEMLGLTDSVVFPGHIKFDELLAYYTLADAFICMSEHEGFCVPLVEAMYFNVPIIAFKCAAIPDTMGNQGLLLDNKEPAYVAAIIDRVLTDATLKQSILRIQEERLNAFSYDCIKKSIEELLDNVIRNDLKKQHRIIQLSTTISRGDAISNDIAAFQKFFLDEGYSAQTFTEIAPKGTGWENVWTIDKLSVQPDNDIAIYHHGTGTSLAKRFAELPCKKILVYHNVTPPAFFEPFDKNAAKSCQWGLDNLKEMKDSIDGCIADSSFNKDDLRGMGYDMPISVCPVLVPFEDYSKEPDMELLHKLQDGKRNIIFVGRIAPNKKIEDVINIFGEYQKRDRTARLVLVGSYDEGGAYYRFLKNYISSRNIDGVEFSGHIPFAQILSYYRAAHAFVCMSEHEGFCVPLVEAMYFDVPIIAYACAAIPETLGGCGILLHDKNPQKAADAIEKIMDDAEYRKKILRGQSERLKFFSYENVSGILKKEISNMMEKLV